MNTLITGPMFSGKSTFLLQKIERAVYGKKRVLLIRPQGDDRGYFTHSEGRANGILSSFINENKIDVKELTEFSETNIECIKDYDCIFVDEYFMIKNNALLAKAMQDNCGNQDIYFAGLLSTSENQLFDEAITLLPYCENIIKLNGVCMECGDDNANYSMYKGDSKTEKIIVGDEDKYECVCKACYEKIKGKAHL